MDDAELERKQQEDALVEAGMEAKDILTSPAFINTVTRLSKGFSDSLFNTRPDEVVIRERYYNLSLSLQAIVDLLVQDVSAADEIIEARNEA
jgi:hypothetical protein